MGLSVSIFKHCKIEKYIKLLRSIYNVGTVKSFRFRLHQIQLVSFNDDYFTFIFYMIFYS